MTFIEADLIAAREYLQTKIADCFPDHDAEVCERLAFAIDRLITVHVGLLFQERGTQ